eukprot:Nk52_evm101s914 gene=Nk52_evmTU101s914
MFMSKKMTQRREKAGKSSKQKYFEKEESGESEALDEDEYEVEEIVYCTYAYDINDVLTHQFRIKWKGFEFDPFEVEWVSLADINSRELIDDYEKRAAKDKYLPTLREAIEDFNRVAANRNPKFDYSEFMEKIYPAREEEKKKKAAMAIKKGKGKRKETDIERGKEKGNDNGREKGKEKAKENGREKGKDKAKEDGREKGKEKAKENGREKGKEKAKENGREKGKDKAKEDGREKGKDKAKEDGREKGKEKAKEDGREKGKEKGSEIDKSTVKEIGKRKVNESDKGKAKGKAPETITSKGIEKGSKKERNSGKSSSGPSPSVSSSREKRRVESKKIEDEDSSSDIEIVTELKGATKRKADETVRATKKQKTEVIEISEVRLEKKTGDGKGKILSPAGNVEPSLMEPAFTIPKPTPNVHNELFKDYKIAKKSKAKTRDSNAVVNSSSTKQTPVSKEIKHPRRKAGLESKRDSELKGTSRPFPVFHDIIKNAVVYTIEQSVMKNGVNGNKFANDAPLVIKASKHLKVGKGG